MEKLQTYNDVLKYLHDKNRIHHLLLGNGFSVAYNKDIFSYNALNEQLMHNDDEEIKAIFNILNTQNFEIVMQQLENYAAISKILSAPKNLIDKVSAISANLKQQLLDIITELHPEQVFNISEEKSKSCARFLQDYLINGKIFSTNYDLLLYWVLMRNNINNCIDGFGREIDNKGTDEYIKDDDVEWSELIWGKYKDSQNVFYLHGALPIFDDRLDIIKEEWDSNKWLLDKIKDRIEKGQYPIFVTAGDGDQKLYHIRHNQYLNYCYDSLCKIEGSLVVFGFSFGNFDKHIIKAINVAAKNGKPSGNKLFSVYIGVYSDEDYKHIQSIKSEIKCKVKIFDAKTANIWNE
jgi:hypothetical protein